jgi:hypothetical protein
MLKVKFGSVLAGAAALFATTAVLTSEPTDANAFAITGGICNVSPNCGTVTLTQVGPVANGEVEVKVTLASGIVFASTGAGGNQALLFDIAGGPTITDFTQLSGAPTVTLASTTPGTIHADGSGDWQYGVGCASCNGTSPPTVANPLDFDISTAGLTPASFVTNGSNLFAVDIGIPNGSGGFNTGVGTVVPAPIIGHGLLVLLAVGGVLFGGKFLEKIKARNLRAA